MAFAQAEAADSELAAVNGGVNIVKESTPWIYPVLVILYTCLVAMISGALMVSRAGNSAQDQDSDDEERQRERGYQERNKAKIKQQQSRAGQSESKKRRREKRSGQMLKS